MTCTFSGTVFLLVGMYLPVPPLTKANSLEDAGIVLKVEENEEQKKEIKKESGVEHHDTKEEKQSEQFNEPSTSSGSACPEVKCAFFSDLHIFTLLIAVVQPTLLSTDSGKECCVSLFPCSTSVTCSVTLQTCSLCGTGLSGDVMSVCTWATSVLSSQPPGSTLR